MSSSSSTDESSGPLDGITVLDASRVLAGPFAGMQLGDLGADVIKVERAGVGDQTRSWSPPAYESSTEAAYYLSINRNKRSITLDLGSEDGRRIFRELAASADVLLENFRVGQMKKWGLGYEDLSADNPGLIYCSITGYGQWGPDKNRPAYDLVLQGEGGMMSITGNPDGEPVRVGIAITDIATGLYATESILAALLERELGDGRGQFIDTSLLDSAVALNSYMAMFYFATGNPPGRHGSKIPNIVPYQAFETADDYAIIAVPSPHLWPNFCRALGREDLIGDDRFATNDDRVSNREILEPMLEAIIAEYPTNEIVSIMHDHDVPATPINDMAAVFRHPQVKARGMHESVDHPTIDDLEMPGIPMHFSRSQTAIRRHPPLLGEHTAEILHELGYSSSDIEDFNQRGVI